MNDTGTIPNNLVNGQGIAKIITKSNCKVMGINLLLDSLELSERNGER